jgi:hypothetical protein
MAREIIYPTFVVVLIASVWALGWNKSQSDAIERGFGPGISRNALLESVYDEDARVGEDAPGDSVTSSLFPAD